MVFLGLIILIVLLGVGAFSLAILWHLETFSLPNDAHRWVILLYEILALLITAVIAISFWRLSFP